MRKSVLAGLALAAFDVPAGATEEPVPPEQVQTDDSDGVAAPPFSIEASYTADIWHAASGGLKRGTRYLDNFDLVANADMEALAGWKGATASAYLLYNNGNSFNELTGEAQVVSNIETGVKAVRLYEAWIDQKIGTAASLRVGLYDLNSEFDVLETSGLFIGSAHGIGTEFAQSGENGPSIFPSTSLAARLAVDIGEKWKVRAALLDGVPGDPDHPKRTAIKLGDGDGALLVGEVERIWAEGRVIAGHWRYTSDFDTYAGGVSNNNHGFYVRGETRLSREGDGEQGLSGFFRLGVANGAINPFARFASAGLTYTGALPGRDADHVGVAIAAAFTSNAERRFSGSEDAEIALELTYLASITENFSLQPNVQYIINPNADRTLSNALAFGLRTVFTLSN